MRNACRFSGSWGTALRAKYPVTFAVRRQEILAWHRAQADECEASKKWGAAVFHFDRLIEAWPDDGSRGQSIRERRARAAVAARRTAGGRPP